MDDRVALVTGAGRGLGATIARALAVDGWTVAVNDVTEEATRRTVEAVPGAGGRARCFAADVTDERAVDDLVAEVTTTLGPVTGPHGITVNLVAPG